MGTQDRPSTEPSSPKISRRRLVALGATGVSGAVIAKVATANAAPAAPARLGGVHIGGVGKAGDPEASKGFPPTFIMTPWGPDDALSGTGCGATAADAPDDV